MNTRLIKLGVALYSLCLVASVGSLRAQDTNDDVPLAPPEYPNGTVPQPPGYGGRSGLVVMMPVFDIQIENGNLSLAALKGETAATNFFAPKQSTVRATMENLSKFMQVVDPQLNIVLAPGTGSLLVSDLKLKTSNLNTIAQAISVATGNAIDGKVLGQFGGGRPVGGRVERMLAFTPNQSSVSTSTVEVFNLSGYIQTLDTPNENVIAQKLDDLKSLIYEAVDSLRKRREYQGLQSPDFKYHSGTRLLIVTGSPEAIDVCRKIVNALSGQKMDGWGGQGLDTTPPPAQK